MLEHTVGRCTDRRVSADFSVPRTVQRMDCKMPFAERASVSVVAVLYPKKTKGSHAALDTLKGLVLRGAQGQEAIWERTKTCVRLLDQEYTILLGDEQEMGVHAIRYHRLVRAYAAIGVRAPEHAISIAKLATAGERLSRQLAGTQYSREWDPLGHDF